MKTILLLSLALIGCTKPPPKPVTPMYHHDHPVTVEEVKTPSQPLRNLYFAVNVDSLEIGQVGRITALRNWAEAHGKRIHFTGYADTLGADSANLALSTRRACNAAALVPGSTCEGRGETTEFGADKANRRVTVKEK